MFCPGDNLLSWTGSLLLYLLSECLHAGQTPESTPRFINHINSLNTKPADPNRRLTRGAGWKPSLYLKTCHVPVQHPDHLNVVSGVEPATEHKNDEVRQWSCWRTRFSQIRVYCSVFLSLCTNPSTKPRLYCVKGLKLRFVHSYCLPASVSRMFLKNLVKEFPWGLMNVSALRQGTIDLFSWWRSRSGISASGAINVFKP